VPSHILNKTVDLLGHVHYIHTTHSINLVSYDLTVCGLHVPAAVVAREYDPTVPDRGACKKCERYAHTTWTDGLTSTAIQIREAAG